MLSIGMLDLANVDSFNSWTRKDLSAIKFLVLMLETLANEK